MKSQIFFRKFYSKFFLRCVTNLRITKILEIFLIFKFILIYLLHVLFVLKIEDIFEKKQSVQKS